MSGITWEEYIEGGLWKCSESPTGAHGWIVKRTEKQCKFCKEVREVPAEAASSWSPRARDTALMRYSWAPLITQQML